MLRRPAPSLVPALLLLLALLCAAAPVCAAEPAAADSAQSEQTETEPLTAQQQAEEDLSGGQEALGEGDLDLAVELLSRALDSGALDPDGQGEALLARGKAFQEKALFDRARKDYLEAVRLQPEDAAAYNELGWLHAACPDPAFQDGKKAVRYAKKAVALYRMPTHLDTLAAAYARNGQFRDAAQAETAAIALLKAENPDAGELEEYEARLALYRAGQAYAEEREP